MRAISGLVSQGTGGEDATDIDTSDSTGDSLLPETQILIVKHQLAMRTLMKITIQC